MCLVERVEAWDQATILCSAISHTDVANPLRQHGRLHAVCGVEYAAQVMAVHAWLIDPTRSERRALGLLASVRDLRFFAERLDTAGPELRIEARRLSGGEQGFIYEFYIRADVTLLLSGRLAVMLAKETAT